MRSIHNSSTLSSCILFLLVLFLAACGNSNKAAHAQVEVELFPIKTDVKTPVAQYVRNIHQDKNGDLWFGTNGLGVGRYDGRELHYYSTAEGFGGSQITGISEDPNGNLWFSTDQGVVRYDLQKPAPEPITFTNYNDSTIFNRGHFWSIHADSKGGVWAATGGRVYKFNGIFWQVFELPYADDQSLGNLLTGNPIWGITEDREGNIWFATNGNGAIKYSGNSFTQFTTKDGLLDNNVDHILEDKAGNIWMGTRYGGISRYDGETFTTYSDTDSIQNNEVCVVFEDSEGDIWFSSEGYGVYRYNGSAFTNYAKAQGLGVRAVQTIYEDNRGRIWAGGGGGLYRLEGDVFVEVGKEGVW